MRSPITASGEIGKAIKLRDDNRKALERRDWGKLRERLLAVEDKASAAYFLEQAGFILQAPGPFSHLRKVDAADDLRYISGPWAEEDVSESILQKLYRHQRYVRQLTDDYQSAMKAAPDLHPSEARFLQGTGGRVNFAAILEWARTGTPEVRVALNPLEAVLLWTHLDCAFGAIRLCGGCDKLKPLRSNQTFCSEKCGNRVRKQRQRDERKKKLARRERKIR